MRFEIDSTFEITASDGQYTIGAVNGTPAIWEGNTKKLNVGDEFERMREESTFNDGNEEYVVDEGEWLGEVPVSPYNNHQ